MLNSFFTQVFINFVSQQQEIVQEHENTSTCQPGPPTEMLPIIAGITDPDDECIIDVGTSVADSGCQGDSDVACLLDSGPESFAASSLGIVADLDTRGEGDPLLGQVIGLKTSFGTE